MLTDITHNDGRKKTALGAVVRLELQDANPVSRFLRDGWHCAGSGFIRQAVFVARHIQSFYTALKPHVVQDVPPGEAQATSGSAVI